ncbi:LemA family protein [Acetobacteraceae bacterium]|nr:LemA family protein [Acetobacteraceae bacterium]
MANELDELTGPINDAGQDVHVINKQIQVKVGFGSLLFEIALWTVFFIPGMIALSLGILPLLQAIVLFAAGILPGLIFLFMKINALATLRKLQQRVQTDASQIDNYLEQRVMILNNVVGLLSKAVDLDTKVMESVSAYRSGVSPASDRERNIASSNLENAFAQVRLTVESYPDLKAHAVIADAMRQNSYLQQEITAARSLYNDAVLLWNSSIFEWPTKQIVAARAGYTTRIPFIASAETKAAARGTFF